MALAWPNGVSTLFPLTSETKISSRRSSSVEGNMEVPRICGPLKLLLKIYLSQKRVWDLVELELQLAVRWL